MTMTNLEKTITNKFSADGKEWLQSIPNIISTLADKWGLSAIKPVSNMNWNYVARALRHGSIPVVLKIAYNNDIIQPEAHALLHYEGHGTIKLLEQDKTYHALLLEQAIPGTILKSKDPIKVEQTLSIYADVANRIENTPNRNTNGFKHVNEWLSIIDKKYNSNRIATHLIEKAREIKRELSASPDKEYVLHADLHLENIISNGETWVAIDPKGMIGDKAFEVAACDIITLDKIANYADLTTTIEQHLDLLSKLASVDRTRLLYNIYLRIILSALWFIEDNGDASKMLELAECVYKMI